jgi:hypothetical protein
MLGSMLGSDPSAKHRSLWEGRRVEVGADDLRLTIERGSDPIAGSLGLPDGRALRFEGYVQLVAALEDARKPSPTDDPEEGGTA